MMRPLGTPKTKRLKWAKALMTLRGDRESE